MNISDSERPESYFRRLLWNNSGVLCLATLITLPIILGVAIGYVIVLAFVTTYRKISGKKSREEKESEAAQKIRIVLGNELLDTAFTKPEGLPGQKLKLLRRNPKYSSVDDVRYSSGNESVEESESLTEDEIMEEIIEENLLENENKILVEVTEQSDVTLSKIWTDPDGSRANSASSGHYSTASEMASGRDSRETDTLVQCTSEYKTRIHIAPAQRNCEHNTKVETTQDALLENKLPDVTKRANLQDSGFIEENVLAVQSTNASSDVHDETALNKESKIQDTSMPIVPVKYSVNQDNGLQTLPAVGPKELNSGLIVEKTTAVKHVDSSRTTTSSHHIGTPAFLGKLKYSVNYMRESNELQVIIIKAINLFHEKTKPSSFVKVSLLPQRFCWQKTKIAEETSNPIFNETFVISGFSHERFSHYTLLISVVNAEAPWQGFYTDHVIGEVYIPLYHVAMYSSNQEKVFCQWADLKAKISETQNLTRIGKINLALCYRPISGRLIVTIKKAKDLECENKEKFDPYVKLALYCSGSRVGRGTTRVKHKATNPVFNEKFNFDLNADQIAYTTIVVKLMSNCGSCTGATVIGYESSGDGQEHWLSMMKCLSKHVDAWHTLHS